MCVTFKVLLQGKTQNNLMYCVSNRFRIEFNDVKFFSKLITFILLRFTATVSFRSVVHAAFVFILHLYLLIELFLIYFVAYTMHDSYKELY